MKRTASTVAQALAIGFGTTAAISELFIMAKSGILIRHYSDSLRTDIDRDVLSGMLVAVQEFVQQTLASKTGTLDVLRYGTYTIHFVRRPHTLAAAVARDLDARRVRSPVREGRSA